MTQAKDLLAVKLLDGRTVVVAAPYGVAFEGYLVEDDLGRIGRVINKEMDYDGSLRRFLEQFENIYTARVVWSVAWEAQEVKTDA